MVTVGENIIGAPILQNDYGEIFQYCDNIIGVSFAPCIVFALDLLCLILVSILCFLSLLLRYFLLSPLRARKSDNDCCCNSWKGDNHNGSNIEKKP